MTTPAPAVESPPKRKIPKPIVIAAVVTLAVVMIGARFIVKAAFPEADRPVASDGKPLALDDPERYLPKELAGMEVGKLPPPMQDDVGGRADEYGLGEWVDSYTGATVIAGSGDFPRAFVNVVRTNAPDDAEGTLGDRVAYFGAGQGTIESRNVRTIRGQTVRTGTIHNAEGTFPFAVWNAQPDVTVAITTRGPAGQIGIDPTDAMRELIDWSTK